MQVFSGQGDDFDGTVMEDQERRVRRAESALVRGESADAYKLAADWLVTTRCDDVLWDETSAVRCAAVVLQAAAEGGGDAGARTGSRDGDEEEVHTGNVRVVGRMRAAGELIVRAFAPRALPSDIALLWAALAAEEGDDVEADAVLQAAASRANVSPRDVARFARLRSTLS